MLQHSENRNQQNLKTAPLFFLRPSCNGWIEDKIIGERRILKEVFEIKTRPKELEMYVRCCAVGSELYDITLVNEHFKKPLPL